MNFYLKITLSFWFAIFFLNTIHAQNFKVIVFSKTEGYRHRSIEAGIESIKEIGKRNNFKVDATEDAEVLISGLKQYDAVIFLSPSGDILNDSQQKSFRFYIENGGGFIGIHSATAAEKDWDWYGEMLGGVFTDHPKIQVATIKVSDHKHPSTSFLGNTWIRNDEWYNFSHLNPKNKILLRVDENTYTGGKHGKNHPITWYQEFNNRRMFYTALGHTVESFQDEVFLKHLTGGILFVLDKK